MNKAEGSLVPAPPVDVTGSLHLHVAFDWGDEIDLAAAQRLAPAEIFPLLRRRRTPSSIAYRPPPLRFLLPPVRLTLAELGEVEAAMEVTCFDFAAVSVELHLPIALSAAAALRLAASLADAQTFVQVAKENSLPLFRTLQTAIQGASWSEMSEEFVVFRLAGDGLPTPAELSSQWSGWLAGMVRLESEPLSAEEIAESLRYAMSYSPRDLFVAEWGAAVVLDEDCEETLQAIELANLQLLELRNIDERLDRELARAYKLIHPLARRGGLPIWASHHQPLRALGELRVEANGLFERTTNVLKMFGDQYLARVYQRLSKRFHLDEWSASIRQALDVVEGVYHVVSDQAAAARAELMEVTVIFLIALEIALAFWRH